MTAKSIGLNLPHDAVVSNLGLFPSRVATGT